MVQALVATAAPAVVSREPVAAAVPALVATAALVVVVVGAIVRAINGRSTARVPEKEARATAVKGATDAQPASWPPLPRRDADAEHFLVRPLAQRFCAFGNLFTHNTVLAPCRSSFPALPSTRKRARRVFFGTPMYYRVVALPVSPVRPPDACILKVTRIDSLSLLYSEIAVSIVATYSNHHSRAVYDHELITMSPHHT